ncbi:MAG: ABC transporter ATP-binding protein [Chloroflexota bacterium]
MTDEAIKTEGLSRRFAKVQAVDDLSLTVPKGIVFGFLGPNGSGKTTTIRLLLGLLEPSRGHARVMGFDTIAEGDKVRERCGALLEHPGLYERLSAEDNLDFFGRVWHMSAAERQARSKELLSHMGLWERRRDQVGTWSRGMKQKLAVARTVFHRPPLIFLDEPTAGLDPVASAALREDIRTLAEREGTTVFLTTHNLAEAEKLCGRVAVIRKGKLVAEGHPDELRARTGGPQVEVFGRGFTEEALAALRLRPEVAGVKRENGHVVIDLRQDTATAPLVGALVGAGVEVEEVRKGTASLEEAFLAMMEEKGE